MLTSSNLFLFVSCNLVKKFNYLPSSPALFCGWHLEESQVRKWLSVFCWPIDRLNPGLHLWDQSEKIFFFKAAVVFLNFLEVQNLFRQHNYCCLHPPIIKTENSFKYKLLKPDSLIYIDIFRKKKPNHF